MQHDSPGLNATLREDPSQINVILQQKLLAAKLSTLCTVVIGDLW